ncbi:hypothetical protein OIU77_026187 [Salix suchowensis]|uniref:Ubiquitin-like domain-containing protein n=1 Tax=Salix suchowensis TaxID=1278906 RepID=A0ABQ9C0Y6_9ROSI|nr:hypothetical protein OIU77_026187 [Salix suchowensis]
MANECSHEGSGTSHVSGEGSDATIELNIKTLDSQIYSFQVDKNMPVSIFKEKIANEIGIPLQGSLLNHNLQLVQALGIQWANNSNQVNDASAGAPRNRIGQVSHSVVLETFNVGDQGEGIVPDLFRVIGAALNSFGVSGQAATSSIGGMQSSNMPNFTGLASQGSETDGLRGNVGGQSSAGNQTRSGQPFQSAPQVVQVPLSAAIPVPSLHTPIPDSLNTLSEFITRMERVLAHNGNQPNTSTTSMEDPTRVELPSNARGYPTPEALSIVLRHAARLLSGPATTALSDTAGCLEQDGSSTDPAVRGQIQTETMQVGLAMQHLGALFLELGRTILTLRMGQPPAEPSVNAGPAVYISPSGPNPIMVQPFPLQTSSLFGSSVPPSNPMAFGPVGAGNAPRHVNIHIHAAPVIPIIGTGTSGTGIQGEHAVTDAAQPVLGISLSQPPSDSMSLSSIMSGINSQLRQIAGNRQGGNQPASGSAGSVAGNNPTNLPMNSTVVNGAGESSVSLPGVMSDCFDQKAQAHDNDPLSLKDTASSSVGILSSSVNIPSSSVNVLSSSVECPNVETSQRSQDTSQNASSSSTKSVPLGLGLGSLDRKRRNKPNSLGSVDSGTTNSHLNRNPDAGISGQQLLQSLASISSSTNSAGANDIPSDPVTPFPGQVMEGRPLRDLSSDSQFDSARAMSQVLQSPVMNNLFAGVSEQTGAGSPNIFRNMLQQLTQNPQIMNTVSQIAQQVLGQELPAPQLFPTPESEPQTRSNEREYIGAENPNDNNIQINLHEVAQRIEQFAAPQDVFQAIVGNAVRLNRNGSNAEDILRELNNNEDLASNYVEMLQRDIQRRLQEDSGEDKLLAVSA